MAAILYFLKLAGSSTPLLHVLHMKARGFGSIPYWQAVVLHPVVHLSEDVSFIPDEAE